MKTEETQYNGHMKDNETPQNTVPHEILTHLRGLIRDTDLPDTEESLELLIRAWTEKEALFTAQTVNLGMLDLPAVEAGDSRALLLLTNSGSLISLYSQRGEGRDLEYASINLRSDVPGIVRGEKTEVSGSIRTGVSLELSGAPLKKTSPVYRIAVCSGDLDPDEQDTRIREATIFLTNGFVRINKQITNPGEPGVDHFTKMEIISYIAGRNGMSQKAVRQVLDDYLYMLESAMVMGEKVNLGRLGRLFIDTRPPQKARVGRNPATGEELTIPAKPARGVPKISFSRYMKERAEPLK